jgi:tRNA (cmo5U34)-methyltransferase
MSDAARIFDAHAAHYDASRRRLVPDHDAFYAAAVDALRLAERPPERVIDLGAGTGLLSRLVLDAHPDARITLLDAAPAMLAEAEKALGDRAAYVVGDLREALPDGEWDAVVSALAIHHLEHEDKRTLFARIGEALAPGGVFVNADQVAAPTPHLEDAYGHAHEAHARGAGSDDAEWSAATHRMKADRLATLEDQLGWLREAGLTDIDVIYKNHAFAVIVGRRA